MERIKTMAQPKTTDESFCLLELRVINFLAVT